MVEKIPLVRSLYSGAKQIIEAVTNSQVDTFSKVVMIEYPRKGLYSLGFITCEAKGEIQKNTDDFVINVFVPTTPNPTSGMLVFVSKKDVIPLSMTVEEGIKLVVSGGIVTPLEKNDFFKTNELEA